MKSGSSLISVHSDDSDETKRAKEIFEQKGATDITTAGELAVPAGSGPLTCGGDNTGLRIVMQRRSDDESTDS